MFVCVCVCEIACVCVCVYTLVYASFECLQLNLKCLTLMGEKLFKIVNDVYLKV